MKDDPALYADGYLHGLEDGERRANLQLVIYSSLATLVAVVAIVALAIYLSGGN